MIVITVEPLLKDTPEIRTRSVIKDTINYVSNMLS